MSDTQLIDLFTKWSSSTSIGSMAEAVKLFHRETANRKTICAKESSVEKIGAFLGLKEWGGNLAVVTALIDTGAAIATHQVRSSRQNIQHILVDALGRFQGAATTIRTLFEFWSARGDKLQLALRWNGAVEACRQGYLLIQDIAGRESTDPAIPEVVSELVKEVIRVPKATVEIALEDYQELV